MNVSKKEIFLALLVLVLVGLYAFYFTDWFKGKYIRVEHSARPLREAWGNGQRVDPTGKQVNNVTFSLLKDYQLTSVQVVPLVEFQTNNHARPLWQLVSKTGSRPVNGFAYGAPIAGMAPVSVLNAEAQPLEPGVEYRLLVEASSIKGTNDFNIPISAASRQ